VAPLSREPPFRRRPRHAANLLDQLLVYHPDPWEDRDWGKLSGLPLEEVWFRAAGGPRLFGWYVQASPGSPVLLWCHGNAGNLIHRLDNMAGLYRSGLSHFIFDYRGYGRSEGKPSEEGLYRDGLAAYAHLTETRQIPPKQLVMFGRSLGAAIAGEVASQRSTGGLILEGSFPSVEAVAKAFYFGLPVHWLISARFPLSDKMKRVHAPVLIIHGEQDEVIPVELGRQVFEAANEPKSLYLVPGAGHNDCYLVGGSVYFSRLNQFIRASTA